MHLVKTANRGLWYPLILQTYLSWNASSKTIAVFRKSLLTFLSIIECTPTTIKHLSLLSSMFKVNFEICPGCLFEEKIYLVRYFSRNSVLPQHWKDLFGFSCFAVITRSFFFIENIFRLFILASFTTSKIKSTYVNLVNPLLNCWLSTLFTSE